MMRFKNNDDAAIYNRLLQSRTKRIVKEEFDPASGDPSTHSSDPTHQSDDSMSDEQSWAEANPDITSDSDLSSTFDVEGLTKPEIEKYSSTIQKWNEGIGGAIDQLAQIIKFAAGERLENSPGSEQFAALIKNAPRLKSDLSAFKSQVEDLEQTVKLAINDAANERKDKLNSLQ